jgi:multidrug efflux pump subunit AcrB
MDADDLERQSRRSSLVGWFAANKVAANIVMVFLLVSGFISVRGMVTETFPSMDPRTITIATPYPGATPYDVEESITRRVEEAVTGIEGVKRVTSKASEGAGVVTVEMEDFADQRQVLDDVETAVDRLVDFPPEEAEETSIIKNKRTSSMMSLAVYGDADETTLHYWARKIEGDLLQLPEVTLANLSGGRALEIAIEVSEETLRHYGLTHSDISRRIAEFSIDVPAGTLRTQAGDILIRVQDKRYTGAAFENITIRSRRDGARLRLGDIATISDDFEDTDIVNQYNGKPALFVRVSRSSNQDTLDIELAIKDYLSTVSLPKGLSVEIWRNSTDILRDRISLLVRNGILGYILVFLSLLLFLDLKLAFWTSLGIPISFMGGLLLVSFTGISMNMITLFALIIVIGIVVDDAIVIGESIYAEQERNPGNTDAVLDGVFLVKSPVTIGVLTSIAAFAPLMFSTGRMAQIMLPVPLVVIGILAISLVEAFYILPAHLASTKRWSRGLLASLRDFAHIQLTLFVDNLVVPAVRLALRYRYVSVAIGCASIILTLGIFQGGIVRFIFFPQIDSDHITVTLKMPPGTPFETTYHYAEKILAAGVEMASDAEALMAEEGIDEQIPLVEAVSFTVGSQGADGTGPFTGSGGANATHLAQIRMELVPGDQRPFSSRELERNWRHNAPTIPGVESLTFRSNLVRPGDDISVELSHRDEDVLARAAAQLKQSMVPIDGVSEVEDSFEPGKREYVFELTAAGLAAGLTPMDIGRQLRFAYYGAEVHRVQRGRDELKVMVRYPKTERRSLSDLYNTRIRLNNGSAMDLRAAASIREQRGYSEIERVDGRRIVSVSANVEESITTPDDVVTILRQDVMAGLITDYPGLSYSFEGVSRDQSDDLTSLLRNLMIAVMVMFVMLASQLRSYIQPVIILSAIPFGFVGSVIGHLLMGFDISFISIFGMIALSGVVINDSIVLVDYFNHVRQQQNLDVQSALIVAVARRFRPILLTTMTTSLGLLPMLTETSLQARFLIPMAVSIAFGILYASVVIIFLVPALLVIAEDLRAIGRKIAGGHSEATARR